MQRAAVILGLYALLVFLGGVVGYVNAASRMSLVMGSVFGLLVLGCAFALYKAKKAALWFALGLVFLLDAFFTFKFAKNPQFFPSGLFSFLSLAALMTLVVQLRKKPIS